MPKDLTPPPSDTVRTQAFTKALSAEGFLGDIAGDFATRAVMATDNSVYEVMPDLVLFPREPDDLGRIMRAAATTGVPVTMRGGGTGTNGQSLTSSTVVDCSRYLTAIEHIDPETRIAVVQPGVILDQLNRAAGQYGLFFAPNVSTASRATLGGMVATDASGKGSRKYGRTSDHIAQLDVVLPDGTDWSARPLDEDALAAVCVRDDLPGALHRHLSNTATRQKDEIARVFPAMNRGLTGYNLKELYDAEGRFHLSKLLAGSEGSLALTKRITLRLLPKPPCRALMVVAYDDALDALRDVPRLVGADPLAVEFIDDRIVDLAREDPIWTSIAHVLDTGGARVVKGLNFVEVVGQDKTEIDTALARLDALPEAPGAQITRTLVRDAATVTELWSLRSKAVGLLGRMDPTRQGTPFVEDAAVPPEALPDFVAGFRDVLEAQGLAYGMFGHADVGCLHVRPALDMRIPGDAAKLRPVSDAIDALARKHGGLIWGEHGKGVRGEYGPGVFGPKLYAEMCRIKALFDPNGLLNPGKIATPDPKTPLLKIDGIQMRGPLDAAIDSGRLDGFGKAVKCNGNGQCFNRDMGEAMCPSYKATGDRRLSPKGRATLFRHWLRQDDSTTPEERKLVETALKDSLDLCLSCKACVTQCPVQVDIPAMRARFMAEHYGRVRRPLRHYLLGAMEPLSPLLRGFPRTAGLAFRLGAPVMRQLGLADLPLPAPARRRTPRPNTDTRPGVILLEDSFNATFDGAVIEAAAAVLEAFGYRVTRAAPSNGGKALHVTGQARAFAKVARRAVAREARLAASGQPVLALDPAMIDLSRSDYAPFRDGPGPVQAIEAFLAEEARTGRLPRRPQSDGGATEFVLFEHCMGRATDPAILPNWQAVFAHLGHSVRRQPTTCCGMAGAFGHEVPNLGVSRKLWDDSWAPALTCLTGLPMANGFSCRCQSKRYGKGRLPHPVERLAEAMGL